MRLAKRPDKSKRPDSTTRGRQISALVKRGVDIDAARQIIRATRTHGENVDALKSWLRERPKA